MPKTDYSNVKKKYDQLTQKEALKQIKSLKPDDMAEQIIYNKYELHDTRLLLGAIIDLVLKKKLITKKELKEEISMIYKDEIKQHGKKK